ncbi:MAG: hypothetical protein MZU97_01515 [Bacillus subtilis]|nr:hypothetical protein [Bacillus subtilis]
MRDGAETEINIADIVLDDVLRLRAGKQIAADAIVHSGEIAVNESNLTGESDAIYKKPGDRILSGQLRRFRRRAGSSRRGRQGQLRRNPLGQSQNAGNDELRLVERI